MSIPASACTVCTQCNDLAKEWVNAPPTQELLVGLLSSGGEESEGGEEEPVRGT